MRKHWKLAVLFAIALAASALAGRMSASDHPDDPDDPGGCGGRPSPPEEPAK